MTQIRNTRNYGRFPYLEMTCIMGRGNLSKYQWDCSAAFSGSNKAGEPWMRFPLYMYI